MIALGNAGVAEKVTAYKAGLEAKGEAAAASLAAKQ